MIRVLISLILFMLIAPLTAAQTTPPDIAPRTCNHRDAVNARPEIAFTVQDGTLSLVDAASGGVLQVLATDYLNFYPHNIHWLENCRYLFVENVWRPDGTDTRRFNIIYDTYTGQPIFQSGFERLGIEFVWSPSRQQFLIKSLTGLYLMSESMDAPVLLETRMLHYRFARFYRWDEARGQLLVQFWRNPGYITVYDIHTGAEIVSFGHPDACSPYELNTTGLDGRYVVAYTLRGDPACVTVYDRDTRTVVTSVNAERYTGDRNNIALSPDARYLVVGFDALRVWDLTAQPEDFTARLPQHRHAGPVGTVVSLAFVDETTIETVSTDGVQRWNVHTGELTP